MTNEKQKPQLTARDYQDAIDSQNACNLSGVIHSLSRVLPAIWAESNGTDEVNQHPIVKLYAEQIAHLSNGREYSNAHNICQCKAKRAA